MEDQSPGAKEQQVDRSFPGFDGATDVIDCLNQTDVGLDESEHAVRIHGLAFIGDTISGLLGATNKVNIRLASMFRKLL